MSFPAVALYCSFQGEKSTANLFWGARGCKQLWMDSGIILWMDSGIILSMLYTVDYVMQNCRGTLREHHQPPIPVQSVNLYLIVYILHMFLTNNFFRLGNQLKLFFVHSSTVTCFSSATSFHGRFTGVVWSQCFPRIY